VGTFKPESVWTCEGDYKNEDKAVCKNEVIKILKQCKKEDVFINSPAVANLIYNNRLRKRGTTKEDSVMEDTLSVEKLPEEKEAMVERLDMNKTVPIASKEKEHISATERIMDDDEAELRKDKEASRIIVNNVILPEQKGKEGLAALQEYTQAGIGLIGAYDNGAAIAKGDDYEKAFSCDLPIIENLWLGNDKRTNGQEIRRYYFKPIIAGLICLDIDCKNGKDGISEFYNFCRTRGKSKEQLPKMLQELPNNFPCFVKTPNDGYHLYFKDRGKKEVKIVHLPHLPNALAVEVKTKQLTAAGSFKDGKPYVLYGKISAAPLLPNFIENAIFNTETIGKNPSEIRILFQKQKGKQHIKSLQQKKDWGKPSWDKITEWTQEDKFLEISTGRNKRAFYLALHAKTHKYTFDETLNEILNDTTVNSLPEREIRDVVKSVYKAN
jgi:hypothetical protein